MNREIKFRGQRVDNKEWVYGWYVNKTPEKHQIVVRDFLFPVNVIPETVGQLLFTTLSDLELFDGDIFDIGQTVNGQSEFVIKAGKYGIEIFYNYDRSRSYEYSIEELLKDEMNEIKIIGNIHSNPSLLTTHP